MTENIRKVLSLLSQRERRYAWVLTAMVLIMALLDIIGIASIMPFIAILADPSIIQKNEWLSWAYDELGFGGTQDFLFFSGVVVFVTLVISICFKAATNWAIMYFAQVRAYTIARRLVGAYLRQPYEWFLNRNSADLGKMALSEVQLVVQGALMPMLHFLAQGVVVVAILLLLLAIDPKLAITIGLGMGGMYGLIYLGLRRLLGRAGKQRVVANADRFKAVAEAFTGIKEVKFGSLEEWALSRFDRPAKKFARTQVIEKVVGSMPRYALEIVAFGGMLLLILYLMSQGDELQHMLPIIALYAMAGYRLMPALQTAYNHATKLRFAGDALDRLSHELESLDLPASNLKSGDRALSLGSQLELRRVVYSYPGADRPSVDSVDISIAANTTVGFVGSTGSGKSTTIDIVLGLLQPQEGCLVVDGDIIGADKVRAWRGSIGYVSQHIYLADDTIAANIAFGVKREAVNMDDVRLAAKIANIDSFIENELPAGYETKIGERGMRLSGGQRQRIGIARAIYSRPSVLVLDEATSALDGVTEEAVMRELQKLSGDVTVILVAHRLNTVKNCDALFFFENGRVVARGTYDELFRGSEEFRAMAGT